MKPIEFEVRIGLFVFIGIILLTVITFSIGDFFFKPGYNINVIMGFANGVEESAPVRLAGIEVGDVRKTSVFKDETGTTKVKLKLWLTGDAKVEKDAKVCINTLGLIGEKYVEIIPGTPGAPVLKDEDTIAGHDSVSVEQMTKKGYEIALKLEKVVDSLDYVLNQVKTGKGTVGRLVFDDKLYNDIDEMVNDIDEMVKDIKAHPWKLLSAPQHTKEMTKEKAGDKDKRSPKQGKGGYF